MNDKAMTLEQTQELFAFLQGENRDERITISEGGMPKLTPKQAFSVIYYLQEAEVFKREIISDVYEKCDECQELFDTDSEGHTNQITHKFYCDSCEYLDDVDDSEER